MNAQPQPKSDFLLLIVDDEKTFLEAMSAWFKNQGYRVATASSGEEALKAVQAVRPNIVFLDYMMPGMDGMEVLRRIRKTHPRLPVVMLSAYAHEDMRVEAYKLGANGVFDKSVDFYNAENLLNSLVRVMSKDKTFFMPRLRGGVWLAAGIAVLILLLWGVFFVRTAHPQVCFRNACVRVEIADTQEERAQGLMNRPRLAAGAGMLFIFPESGSWPFWMKDTYFPLDILWMNDDRQVVEVVRRARPAVGQLHPPEFGGTVPARYVLEVPAGFAERYGVEKGTRARFTGV
ncbi:MAG: DUF192 domain-containing protein [Deltaproteobacteria bacterium]